MNVGLLILRVVAGGVLAAHGAQKVFGWFSGHGIDGTAGFLESLGFRPSKPHAWVLGLSELIGGTCLALGLFTPFASAAGVGVMTAAIVSVHWSKGFFNQDGGLEFPLVLGTAFAAVAFTGPGRYSLDRAFDWTLAGDDWGVVAVAAGLVGAGALLAERAVRVRHHHMPA